MLARLINQKVITHRSGLMKSQTDEKHLPLSMPDFLQSFDYGFNENKKFLLIKHKISFSLLQFVVQRP